MQLGTQIAGRYRLDDRIAAGGMGEVWRATDTRLNRVVAVKLLHSGLAGNDRFRARFHQEAQAVAALQSPGIVALYDYGEEQAPEGVVSYLIMELVRGTALDKLIRQRGRLSPAETLAIIASAAEALDVAHRSGIIHRDIKPGNLLIDEAGASKIVDFGIAAARGQAGLTETGTVMGTLSYASPEQLQGGQLTGATDQYSLGIVAYECLSGRTPFPGTDPTAVITAHLTGRPAPLPPDVPEPVAQIVMRCLAKDPRARFASAADLARACREGRPGPGQGTTAILPPAASPPPDATRAMAQGVVPGQTQPMSPARATGRDAASPRDDWPAPREEEEPRRNPMVPVILTAAGALVLLIALFVWAPWQSGDEDEPIAGDDASTEAVDSDPDETSDAAEETARADDDDEGGGNGNGNGSGQQTPDDEPEGTTEEEDDDAPEGGEGIASLDDYTGQHVADAESALGDAGFTNVTVEATASVSGDESPCEVVSQNPAGPTEASYDTPITLEYVANDPGCMP